MSILIKKVKVNNKLKDVYVENGRIVEISDNISVEAEHKINCERKAILPGFVNAHTHCAMTLFRGYADDMKLMDWLSQKIWPNEEKLNDELVYQGSKLACLEMIKSGIAMFNDMYWNFDGTIKATSEMGMRSVLSPAFIDLFDEEKAIQMKKNTLKCFNESKNYNGKINFSVGPHSIYTVSKESLIWCKEFADKNNVKVHIHISETEQEVKDCIKKNGIRPVEYLEKIGFLGENVIGAHCVWLNDNEINILSKNKVDLVYNPVSNMKLSVNNVFSYKKIRDSGLNVSLGTDGAASNNNLNMFNTMKIGSLLQKQFFNDPTLLNAQECFNMATKNGYKAFNLDGGSISEGKIADFMLVDLNKPELLNNHNLISDMVYAANPECVNTLVIDGKIVMDNRKVKNESEILNDARSAVDRFLK